MRIVASACLVLVILFMVGCGTSAEDKKLIQEQGTKLTQVDKKVGDIEKMAQDMGKKLGDVETFLKDGKSKFGGYGAPPPEVKPPAKPGEKPAAPAPAEKPKSGTPAKTKEPGKTK